ncbi:hypothetical protein Tco_0926363 [Tanacetum coccineum]|uniref:Uncharacterized protein n=1 Tax=Tanacetum coccineum TaxID=301880 RepID=A0ABQ5DAI4_9ASTR
MSNVLYQKYSFKLRVCLAKITIAGTGDGANWNDHFFWVDEFVVPANARFSWFLGSNIVKDRAPAPSEYNVEHVNALIAQASLFLRFPEEFLCWVGISRNYLLNKDTYPRFEYENGEGGSYFPDGARAENERWGLLKEQELKMKGLLSRPRDGQGLSQSMVQGKLEREFAGDASVGDGEDQGFDSVSGQDNVEPTVPVTAHVETEIPGPKRTKKKRVAPNDSRLMVEQGVRRSPLPVPRYYFILHSFTVEEGEDHTDLRDWSFFANCGSLHKGLLVYLSSSASLMPNSADPEVEFSCQEYEVRRIRSLVLVPSISSEKDGSTLSLFTGRSCRSQNKVIVNQVHELETSSTDLREKLKMYEGSLKQLEEFQDNLMRPLKTRLAEIDADFTRCCMRFQESFHPHLLNNIVQWRRWILTHMDATSLWLSGSIFNEYNGGSRNIAFCRL